jgi:hypothetical protein
MNFKFGKSADGKITFDPEVLQYAFSALLRANKNQKGKNYAMIGECVSIQEMIIPSRTEAMLGRNQVSWLELIPEETNKKLGESHE